MISRSKWNSASIRFTGTAELAGVLAASQSGRNVGVCVELAPGTGEARSFGQVSQRWVGLIGGIGHKAAGISDCYLPMAGTAPAQHGPTDAFARSRPDVGTLELRQATGPENRNPLRHQPFGTIFHSSRAQIVVSTKMPHPPLANGPLQSALTCRNMLAIISWGTT